MTERLRYRPPLKYRAVHIARWPMKILLKIAVPLFAIKGKYPPLMLTPDDPVSPFGSGTTKGASREPTMMKIYRRFGRYVGDVVWLAWRNSGYGIAYYLKPEWLKRPGIRYMDLTIEDERTPEYRRLPYPGDPDAYDDNNEERVGTVWVQCPDGTWLWETTRKIGPIYVITGYRLSAVASGAEEDRWRVATGREPIPRPLRHPNMDGRRIVSFRSRHTM